MDNPIETISLMYLQENLSTTEISKLSIERLGSQLSNGQVYRLLKKNNIPMRSLSDSVSISRSILDQSIQLMDDKTVSWADGFLLGDGSASVDSRTQKITARFSIGSLHEEWATYGISGFKQFQPSTAKPTKTIDKKHPSPTWMCRTLSHPDITKQYHRWYPNGTKKVPYDVRITHTSVLLWYLGDGSICSDIESNYSAVRLATCSFSIQDIEDILIPKLKAVGIESVREKSKNDIRIRTSSIGSFFDFIGHTSPIQCYNYKFDVPSWLYLNRLEDIAKNKKERWRAIYHIKKGNIQCTSSPGGKMFLFNSKQADKLRLLLDRSGR